MINVNIGSRINSNATNDNFVPYPNIDFKYGPYPDIATALNNLPTVLRAVGLTVGIMTDINTIKEYWFNNGIKDSNLIEKIDKAYDTYVTTLDFFHIEIGSVLTEEQKEEIDNIINKSKKGIIILYRVGNKLERNVFNKTNYFGIVTISNVDNNYNFILTDEINIIVLTVNGLIINTSTWSGEFFPHNGDFIKLNNLLLNNNEHNFIPKDFHDVVKFNFTSKDGTKNNIITEYDFYDGKGIDNFNGYANVKAKGFVKAGQDDNYVLTAGGDSFKKNTIIQSNRNASFNIDTLEGNYTRPVISGTTSGTLPVNNINGIILQICKDVDVSVNNVNNYITQLLEENTNGKLYFRHKNGTNNWSTWKIVVDNNDLSKTNTNDKIVVRNNDGHIEVGYISTDIEQETSEISAIFFENNNDNIVRKKPLDDFKSKLGSFPADGGTSDKALEADKLTIARNIKLKGRVSGNVDFDGTKNVEINTTFDGIDASEIKSGTISIDRLPKGVIERMYIVPDDVARYKLTKEQVQNGDTVKVIYDNLMYYVVDENNLNNASGYEVYTAGRASSVPWSGITDKPDKFPASEVNWENVKNKPDTYKAGGGHADTAANINNAGTVTLAKASENNAVTSRDKPLGEGSGKPVKLLDFNWYNTKWSIGNIRGGGSDNIGFGIYYNDVLKYFFNAVDFKFYDVVNDTVFATLKDIPDIPNVPNWALQPNKPDYTLDEILNANVTYVEPNTLTRKVIVANGKNGQGYLSRIALGLNNLSNSGFAKGVISVGLDDDGIQFVDWFLNPYDGRINVNDKIFAFISDIPTKLPANGGAADTAKQLMIDGTASTFRWQGNPGQPDWLYGGNTTELTTVWNPSNFRVANATTVGDIPTNNIFNIKYAENSDLWGIFGGCSYVEKLPDGIPVGTYTFGVLLSLPTNQGNRFQIYAPHTNVSSPISEFFIRTGYENDKKAWTKVICDNNFKDFAALRFLTEDAEDILFQRVRSDGTQLHKLRWDGFGYSIDDNRIATVNQIPNVSGFMPKSGGIFTGNITAPAFIKAGSDNTYVLLGGGETKKLEDIVPNLSGTLKVHDTRDRIQRPIDFYGNRITAWFSNKEYSDGAWRSGINVHGWSNNEHYYCWQLMSGNALDINEQLYYRTGKDTTWESWKRLLMDNEVSWDGVVAGNKIPTYTDNGYLAATLFKDNWDNEDLQPIGSILFKNGADGYHRSCSLNRLAQVLPVPKLNGTITGSYDFNDVITPGYYKIQEGTFTNGPTGAYKYGMLEVIRTEYVGENRVVQIYYTRQPENSGNNSIFTRSLNSNVWNDWSAIPNTNGTIAKAKTAEKVQNKLKFTGAVTAEYDGSNTVTVDIPQGGGGDKWFTVSFDLFLRLTTSSTSEEIINAFGGVEVLEEIKTLMTDSKLGGVIAYKNDTEGFLTVKYYATSLASHDNSIVIGYESTVLWDIVGITYESGGTYSSMRDFHTTATTWQPGLMSKEDKAKLDLIPNRLVVKYKDVNLGQKGFILYFDTTEYKNFNYFTIQCNAYLHTAGMGTFFINYLKSFHIINGQALEFIDDLVDSHTMISHSGDTRPLMINFALASTGRTLIVNFIINEQLSIALSSVEVPSALFIMEKI